MNFYAFNQNTEYCCMCCGNNNATSRGVADGEEQFYCDKCHGGAHVVPNFEDNFSLDSDFDNFDEKNVELIFIEHDAMTTEPYVEQLMINRYALHCCPNCDNNVMFDRWNFISNICIDCTWLNHGKNSAGRYSYEYATTDGHHSLETCPPDLSYYRYFSASKSKLCEMVDKGEFSHSV